jgi:hypothetical protein
MARVIDAGDKIVEGKIDAASFDEAVQAGAVGVVANDLPRLSISVA